MTTRTRKWTFSQLFGEKTKRSQTAIGIPGLTISAGRVVEEYIVALRSYSNRVKIWKEMADHPIIGTLLDALKFPILAAPVTVQPASAASEGDKQAALWLEQNLSQMHRQTWRAHMLEALECLEYGYSVAEIVLDKRADGRLWLRNLSPRAPETLHKWGFDEEGQALSFWQRRTDNYAVVEIPLGECVHVAFKGRKGNPEGQSIFQSLYRPWYFLKNMENLEAIGVERDVGGMPVAQLDKEVVLDDPQLTLVENALKALRQDEASYLIAPPGVSISPYGSGSKMYDVGAIIERYQKIILGRFFAQFLKLGMDNVGTQALVQGSQDFFSRGLKFVQEYLLESWNQQLVPYLVAHNPNSSPGMPGNPVLKADPVGKVDVNGILDAVNTAVGAKVFTPSDVDEEWIRGLLSAPDMQDDLKGLDRNIETPPPPSQFAGGFDPSLHPRDDGGQCAPTGGGDVGGGQSDQDKPGRATKHIGKTINRESRDFEVQPEDYVGSQAESDAINTIDATRQQTILLKGKYKGDWREAIMNEDLDYIMNDDLSAIEFSATWDGTAQPEMVTGWRYGDAPSSNHSWNFRDGHAERGVSMMATKNKGGELTTNPDRSFEIFNPGRQPTVYRGFKVGTGSDGEPLMFVTSRLNKKNQWETFSQK